MLRNEPDFVYLQMNYNVSLQHRENALYTVRLKDLADQEHMEQFVQFFVPLWRAKSPVVAAAHLGSWLGALCTSLQDSISRFDRIPVLTLERLSLQIYEEEGRRRHAFHISDPETEEVPVKNRAIWRNRMLASFYSEVIRPLLETASHATGAPVRELWGQFVIRMYNEHERWLQDAATEQQKRRLGDDFEALRSGLPPSVFGLPKNPFHVPIRWIDNPYKEGELIRMRSACCHAYYTESGQGYCYSCPRMSEEERRAKRLMLIAQNA
ncbi:hypothetical protein DNH61_04305 [Paenibacillus sambharensis]|uniref:Ferric siderophore reductase C-terminal domain-containing protein n=1 Tax=Paenibacillus sambharensis TaxID=1803190 RepID=A0A2W1M058_9BACL|nr:hypothetical protein [Paenibacillus sambharensis]PZD97117.1 hypothetical protein DNH61_04305 [Paenibacillus sambharensis]